MIDRLKLVIFTNTYLNNSRAKTRQNNLPQSVFCTDSDSKTIPICDSDFRFCPVLYITLTRLVEIPVAFLVQTLDSSEKEKILNFVSLFVSNYLII